MTRLRRARLLTASASLGFLATAALHSTGHGSIVRLSAEVPGVAELMPALWLAFSSDLVVVGVIVGVFALRPNRLARVVLPIAAACPLAVAGLQVRYIGFVPPTAILIALGALTLASAVAWPRDPRPGPGADQQGKV